MANCIIFLYFLEHYKNASLKLFILDEQTMKIKALPMCMAVVFMFSAENSSGFVTDDLHNEHVHSTCAFTEDELHELRRGLEELENMLKQI